jgi:alpha,alpha-trehalase
VDYDDVMQYIDGYWPQLIQNDPPAPADDGTLIGLPRRYLIPCRREFAEMYYWDSYFMSLGVVGGPHEDIIFDMIENCAHLITRFGCVPNGNRYYFTSRSQPPFFTQMVRLGYSIKQRRGDPDARDWLDRMRQLGAREHETAWLGTDFRHERMVYRGLSRYRDVNANDFNAACESGWDHSMRCSGLQPDRESGRWMDYLPVCLNSILYVRERDLEWAAKELGDSAGEQRWDERADARAATMDELMWNEEHKFYYDYDWRHGKIDKYESLAGFYPLWAGLATKAHATNLVKHWFPKFLSPGGLVTSLAPGLPGRQWAFPNGWAPLQWIVAAGLERYGFLSEAQVVRRWWCENCAYVFRNGAGINGLGRGALLEKYNVEHIGDIPEPGLYGTGIGFGWSNAVFADFVKALGLAKAA